MTDDQAKNSSPDEIIDIEPEVITESMSPKPRGNGLRRAAAIASAALLCAAAGGWFYRDVLARYLPSDQVQALSLRIDALEANDKEATKRADAIIALTDELKAQVGAAQASAESASKSSNGLLAQGQSNAEALDALKQSLAQAQAGLDSVKAQLAQGATGGGGTADPQLLARMDAVEKSLGDLKSSGPAIRQGDVAGLEQAISALDSKIADGGPFVAELQLVATAVPAAEGLDALKAAAESGVPNANQLAAALQQAMAGLPKAVAGETGNGWLDRVQSFFSGLVTIKSLGNDDWATFTAKAAALVAAGDLQQADSLFESAATPAPEALVSWRNLLQRRIAVDEAMAKVKAAVTREIAAKG